MRKYNKSRWIIRRILKKADKKIRSSQEQLMLNHHGELPKIQVGISSNKLYLITSIFGDNIGRCKFLKSFEIGVSAGDDLEFAQKWSEIFEKEYNIRPKIKPEMGYWLVKICCKPIWIDLNSYAVFGTCKWRFKNKAWSYIKKLNGEKLGFGLRGFWDAEGFVDKENKCVRSSSVNKNGLKQIQQLMRWIGIQSKIYGPYTRYGKMPESELYVSRSNLLKFKEMIGFSIRRKQKELTVLI